MKFFNTVLFVKYNLLFLRFNIVFDKCHSVGVRTVWLFKHRIVQILIICCNSPSNIYTFQNYIDGLKIATNLIYKLLIFAILYNNKYPIVSYSEIIDIICCITRNLLLIFSIKVTNP